MMRGGVKQGSVTPTLDGAKSRAPGGRWEGRLSISVTLATAIGLLVSVAVLVVLGLALWSAQKNTRTLLSANAQLAINSAADGIRQHLRAAQDQTRFIKSLIESGAAKPEDSKTFGPLLLGALAAAPQIDAILYVDLNLRVIRAGRVAGRPFYDTDDFSGDPASRKAMRDILSRKTAYWGPPTWRGQFNKTYLNLRRPVLRDGRIVGALAAVVSVRDLSGYLERLNANDNAHLFLLYDRDYVLAHPVMAGGYPGRSKDLPLPHLAKFSDPVLSSIWQTDRRYPLTLKFPEGTKGHVLQIFNDEYIFIYRRLAGFSAKPMLIGNYFRAGDVDQEVRRILRAAVAGLVVLLLSLVAAIFVGRRIARPIKRLSAEAARIGHLEIGKVQELPGSVFRELNEQSKAFNAMLKGLRWFELYVPKKLVERLVKRGGSGTLESERRQLTVMFTDIIGFSEASEGMEARAVAELLNDHFALVAGCIEREGGTVDKFIGDSVMAFWGAPEDQKNRAERACRAALAIAAAIRSDNEARRNRGRAALAVRIGIHSGPATVGNIGAAGRINYTIIGDTVNIGRRLEQLAKTLIRDGREVAVLISEATARELGPSFEPVSLGRHRLRGRSKPVEVYSLE